MEPTILDTSFVAVGIVDTFKSIIWTDRYFKYGEFEVYIPMDSEMISFFTKNYYMVMKESEHTMIIEGREVVPDVEDGDFLIVTGRSLESIIDRRIIWGQKILSGNLQDCIHTLLNENVISPTNADRKISNFIFQASTDTAITSLTMTETQYYGDNLYTVIEALCESNNIGFKIILNDFNQFIFSLYAGVDHTYGQTANPFVVFSPKFDNILNSSYKDSNTSLKNVTLVAGEGEGSDRKTSVVGTGSGLERREIFTDAAGVSSTTSDGSLTADQYTAELNAKGTETLTANTETAAFEGKVNTQEMFVFMKDFFIGDGIEIVTEYGIEGTATILEMIQSESDDNGMELYPTLSAISLTGKVPCGSGSTGKVPIAQDYYTYTGDYKVTPQAFNEQVLPTTHKVLAEDVVIAEVPYWETSNSSNGTTAYIAKGV